MEITITEDEIETATNEFNGLGYNNQRGYLWCLVDITRAYERRKKDETAEKYDWTKFPYSARKHPGLYALASKIGIVMKTEKLSKMAQTLTRSGKKSTLEELEEAA